MNSSPCLNISYDLNVSVRHKLTIGKRNVVFLQKRFQGFSFEEVCVDGRELGVVPIEQFAIRDEMWRKGLSCLTSYVFSERDGRSSHSGKTATALQRRCIVIGIEDYVLFLDEDPV